MMRVLLDTDVNLDFVLQRQPFFAEASEIFTRLGNGEFDAYVSAVTPINVYYFTRKAKGNQQRETSRSRFADCSKNLCG
ncbi:hypothetical protein BH24ACI1_BH24ACI1_24690 [soil metagenome]|jgi:predicted nucleic acid-binding protein